MVRKQIKIGKTVNVRQTTELSRKLWLAGLGVVSVAQKQGQAVVEKLVTEGEDFQAKALKLNKQIKSDAKKISNDLKKQANGLIKPYKQRVLVTVNNTQEAISSRINGVLGKFGVPSKSDIDELLDRVSDLNKQVKTTTKKVVRNVRA